MLWDGAGFHTSRSLVVPENITLVQLPPYSPELNPIENLWHYLKSHFWSNRAYADYDALEKAAMDAWRLAVLDEELVQCRLRRSLPRSRYFRLESVLHTLWGA